MLITRVNDKANPEVAQILECTPEQLRSIANRMEQAEKRAITGDAIHYEITPTIILAYQPEKKISQTLLK